MRILKNLFGKGDKIHVDEIAIMKDWPLTKSIIVDTGKNQHGRWVRFGDGTMIAEVFLPELVLDPIVPGAERTIQIANPVQFANSPNPHVSAAFVDSVGNLMYVPYTQLYGTGVTENYWSISVKNTGSVAIAKAIGYSCFAIGRWK